jgi:hypothetical protein
MPAARKAVPGKRAAAPKKTPTPRAGVAATGPHTDPKGEADPKAEAEAETNPPGKLTAARTRATAARARSSATTDSAADASAAAAAATTETTTPAKRTQRKTAAPKQPRLRKRAGGNVGKGNAGTKTAEVPAERAAVRTPGAGAVPVAARILDHPGYAPELLALAAVDALGPAAQAWVERTRAAYPAATPDALAHLATRKFVRLAGAGGAASATIGLFGPLAELVAVSWAQAGLVLRLAAAYGEDPTDPDRAIDLLVLAKAHPDDDSARAALTAARQAGPGSDQPLQRVAEAAWRLAVPFAVQTGGSVALRLVAGLMPGAAILTAAARGSATVERLGARAVARYRPGRVTP